MSKAKDDVERVNSKLSEMEDELIALKILLQSSKKRLAELKRDLKKNRADIDKLTEQVNQLN